MKMEQIECSETSYSAYEDGTDTVFRNVGIQQSDAGEIPKRIHTRFKTRRNFELKKEFVFFTGQRIN
jgi:protein-arginine kinase activator protein McsA